MFEAGWEFDSNVGHEGVGARIALLENKGYSAFDCEETFFNDGKRAAGLSAVFYKRD